MSHEAGTSFKASRRGFLSGTALAATGAAIGNLLPLASGGGIPQAHAQAAAPAAPKKGKATKVAKPKDDATGPKGAREGSKKAIVLDMLKRPAGATLADIMSATGWQAHYADVRIMPTCVGNPACGAGIAAMESA